jgi:hypothetical protein
MKLLQRLSQIERCLSGNRFTISNEREMQACVKSLLTDLVEVTQEYRLSPYDRVDFYVPCGRSGIAVECKIKGSSQEVLAQLLRYADSPVVGAVVLVTTRNQHRAMPSTARGKPMRTVYVGGLA